MTPNTTIVRGREVGLGDIIITTWGERRKVLALEAGADTLQRTIGTREPFVRAALLYALDYHELVGWRRLHNDDTVTVQAHEHYYSPELTEWQCRECDDCTDFCRQMR